MPEPLVLLSVVLVGCAYARGFRRLQARTGRRHVGRAVAFGAGLAVVLVTLSAPVEHRSLERLWVHMVQHEALVAGAAPLLILGNPLPALLWALPPGPRAVVAPWWRRLSRSHARPSGWVAWAAAAFGVQTVALWGWHAPDPYQAALRSEWLHSLQHASFLATALFFWWAVIGARRRSLYGGGVLVNFAAALQGVALGAYMTLSGRVWYPFYAARDGGSLTPLEDQQVAGVIMWGPGGAAYLVAAIVLFMAWLGGDEPGEESRPRRDLPARVTAEAPAT
ncbi:MAG: cytochrome c oxidase assembly protein [Actinomycetota bacterium]|nr:cytochrome c oxidase assembly protein [Actinomycetota bacterium]